MQTTIVLLHGATLNGRRSPHGVSLWDPPRFGELVREFAAGVVLSRETL